MEIVKLIISLFKEHLAKVGLVFVLGGSLAVVGLIPGTESVSNYLGEKITAVKSTLGTSAPEAVVVQ